MKLKIKATEKINTPKEKEKNPILLKNFLHEVVKILNFLES